MAKPVDIDKMLSESEAGRGPRNLKEQTQMQHGLTRPKQGLYTAPEGPRGGQIKTKDYAPADISPSGDLGIKDDKEQTAFFRNPIKGANAEWRSSKHFAKNAPRISGDETLMGKPNMYAQGGGTVYGQNWKKNHDGLKAGSKVGKNFRGVRATSQPFTNDAGYKNPVTYGSGGSYVG